MTLAANSFFYESGLNWIRRMNGDPERVIAATWRVAQMAWKHHAGRFADGALENPLLELGDEKLRGGLPARKLFPDSKRRSRTLHVATALYAMGGHTRVLAKWIARDTQSVAGVVLTGAVLGVPDFLADTLAETGGELVQLSASLPMQGRAGALRALAGEFDRVILHTHPQDPVPIMAFAMPGGPPVAMFNHAHFGFSLGPSVSDVIVNTMEYFSGVTRAHRFPRKTAILPGTSGTFPFGAEPVDKKAAKLALGMSAETKLVMTIGSEQYFAPTPDYDFFRTLCKLLDRERSVQVIAVGVRANSPLIPAAARDNPRFRAVGEVLDPRPYYRAADVCLESFPMPSLGGLVEAVIYGEAFPVPVYGADESILRVSQGPVLTHAYRPPDEEEYLRFVSRVLASLPEHREAAHQHRLHIARLEEESGKRFHELHALIDTLRHEPAEIPATSMSTGRDSRILAELTARAAAGAPRYLPYRVALPLQIAAAAKGLVPPERAAFEVLDRPWSAIRRRLPKGIGKVFDRA